MNGSAAILSLCRIQGERAVVLLLIPSLPREPEK